MSRTGTALPMSRTVISAWAWSLVVTICHIHSPIDYYLKTPVFWILPIYYLRYNNIADKNFALVGMG